MKESLFSCLKDHFRVILERLLNNRGIEPEETVSSSVRLISKIYYCLQSDTPFTYLTETTCRCMIVGLVEVV